MRTRVRNIGQLASGDIRRPLRLVRIDGRTTSGHCRNTPLATRAAEVVKGAGPGAGGH